MNRDAMLLVQALRDPASTRSLDAEGWTALIAMARAEQLIGTLAHRLADEAVPPKVADILADARTNADYQRRSALWEADCARRALADYPGKVVLLKGTAYVAAGLQAGEGRHIGDLDIMVARMDLPQVEALLLDKGGWEWVKEDAYDDAYYRDHMHELPPLIQKDRDRMIDVHHTILPLTAKPRPDAEGMLARACALPLPAEMPPGDSQEEEHRPAVEAQPGKLYVLDPFDIVIHCATHLFADGDLAGGLRNLWDFHLLVTETAARTNSKYWHDLPGYAYPLYSAFARAARLSHHLYGTDVPKQFRRLTIDDRLFIRRLTARDGWGRATRKLTRLVFYIRSHWLRMPPLMLARHLFTKWRKAKGKS